jgi:hypothetical protein
MPFIEPLNRAANGIETILWDQAWSRAAASG